MAKPKTIKAPKDINPAQASKTELVKKLREFARYTVHLEGEIKAHQARAKELEGQIGQQQDFMVRQQAEIMAQDIRKTEEFQALEARLGSIEDAVTTTKSILTQPD
jgi:hypothetical protein